MGLAWVLIIGAIAVGLGIRFSAARKRSELIEKGDAAQRGSGFFKQRSVFATSIANIADIGGAIDRATLEVNNISFEPDYANGVIAFFNGKGTFGAALRTLEAADGKFRYKFQVESWRDANKYGGIWPNDVNNANVLLTQVEKAFMKLDGDTEVERSNAEYKSKTKLF